MVLKKLGPDTEAAFTDVVSYLAGEEGLLVLVEPHELGGLHARRPDLMAGVDTYTADEAVSLADSVDFVVCLGGDGLVLHASSLFQRAIPPVISFNLGSLGFLTNHVITDFRADLADVIAGREPLGACAPVPPPVPIRLVTGSATARPEPSTKMAAPLATVVPPAVVPSAVLLCTLMSPALTAVTPV